MESKEDAAICPHCGWLDGAPAQSPIHLEPGTRVGSGRYVLGKALGHGGFGITYLAFDFASGRKRAVKEYMPRDFATRGSQQKQVTIYSADDFRHGLNKFLEEANVLVRFAEHPGIVSVLDFFAENDTAYLVMDYLEGLTFKQFLDRQGGILPAETALAIMMPVMDALEEVHSTGMLHRDISPDNIYITYGKQVKVLDFGAARHAMREHSKSLSVILKPGYAPEEQYRTRGKQGPWTDVYAVAATLYRAIVGHVPTEALERLEADSLAPPSAFGIAIRPEMEAALMKALHVRSGDRYPTMRQFQRAIAGQPVSAKEAGAQEAPRHDDGGGSRGQVVAGGESSAPVEGHVDRLSADRPFREQAESVHAGPGPVQANVPLPLEAAGNPHADQQATTAMVLGILSIVLSSIPIISLITGIVGLVAVKKGKFSVRRQGHAKAGQIMSIIGIVLTILVLTSRL